MPGGTSAGAHPFGHAAGRIAAVSMLALWGAGCREGVLDPKGPVGAAQKLLLINSTVIMLAVIIPVIVLTIGFAWWFRAGNEKAHYRPDWSYSGPVELVVWSLPVLVIVFLGGLTWIATHDLDPPKPLRSEGKPVEVQVVSLDWKWLFIYPEQGVASVNRLVVPVGRPVSFRVTSATVMNSFFVPQLGSQIYAMAGMVTRLNLQADEAGSFPGLSANFSGEHFSSMRFETRAVPDAEFEGWTAEARAANRPLDAEAYKALSQPGVAPVTIFSQVDDDLFARIAGEHAAGHIGHAASPGAAPVPAAHGAHGK